MSPRESDHAGSHCAEDKGHHCVQSHRPDRGCLVCGHNGPEITVFTESGKALSCDFVADVNRVHDRIMQLKYECADNPSAPMGHLPKNLADFHGRQEKCSALAIIYGASKTTLLRRAPLFANPLAYGERVNAQGLNCKPLKSLRREKTSRSLVAAAFSLNLTNFCRVFAREKL